MPNQVPIKNNIQKYRKLRGITQENFAQELGVTREYLSKLENQRYCAGTDLMEKVCRRFGVGLGEMFYISDEGLR
ncbi:MAG: putative transcriptional regulator [Anaerosolibacter sp.]|jgi:putative transcriptional regulator|uniref:helix-turn-helix transcriptional regulator n=1 Tax=Anaerosolibacter sp. TaxID=1872527 RepID=UPI00261670B8|nr:helix-turn-helix transcriptional regulator [Anaerosolibacter sp.]MDF2546112.1 putative transcriptional regulator [Anaerosolibacter sp.]